MREMSNEGTVAMGSNPSLSSPSKRAESPDFEGISEPSETPNSHVTHTAPAAGVGPDAPAAAPAAGLTPDGARVFFARPTPGQAQGWPAPAPSDPPGVMPSRGEPRYCTERYEDTDGERVQCGAVLAADLHRTQCSAGLRCYAHCGSVDHYSDAQHYTTVRIGRSRVVRVVRTPGGLYCGHLAVLQST